MQRVTVDLSQNFTQRLPVDISCRSKALFVATCPRFGGSLNISQASPSTLSLYGCSTELTIVAAACPVMVSKRPVSLDNLGFEPGLRPLSKNLLERETAAFTPLVGTGRTTASLALMIKLVLSPNLFTGGTDSVIAQLPTTKPMARTLSTTGLCGQHIGTRSFCVLCWYCHDSCC